MSNYNVEINKYDAEQQDYDKLFPLTKDNNVLGAYHRNDILTDDVKEIYGFDESAVPNDIFRKLAGESIPTIVVTAKSGSTVTATDSSGRVLTATEKNGVWVFYAYSGEWTIKGTNQWASDSKTISISETKQYNVDLKIYLNTLTILSNVDGATFTATNDKGDKIFTSTFLGNKKYNINIDYGIWTIKGEKGALQISINLTVDEEKPYNMQLPLADKILNNNSYETIHQIAKLGISQNIWKVGDRKEVNLNYKNIENYSPYFSPIYFSNKIYAYILDFNYRRDITNGENKIHFQLGFSHLSSGKNCCVFTNTMSSSSSSIPVKDQRWENSDVREFLNNRFLNQCLEPNLTKYIQSVEIKATNQTEGIIPSHPRTEDKIFILSRDEVEGNGYKYYLNGNSLIKYRSYSSGATEDEIDWWLRDSYYDRYGVSYWYVKTNGKISRQLLGDDGGIAPVFCL